MIRCWRVDTPAQTMVFASWDNRLAEIVYWSAPLSLDEDLEMLAANTAVSPGGGMLDIVAGVSVCPEETAGFLGHPGLILTDDTGYHLRPLFKFVKTQHDDEGLLRLEFADPTCLVTYVLNVEADAETDVITLCAELKAPDGVHVHWFSAPVVPAPQLADDFMTFTGRWTGEFQTTSVPWAQGAHMATAPGGRTSHERQPGVFLPERGATQTQGDAYGLHLGWSGGHRLIAEELPSGRRQVQMGATGKLAPEDRPIATPTLYVSYSKSGMNGVSQAFHRHVRQRIVKFVDPDRPRPVHYNCWEAVYFDHKPKELMDLASRAAELGAERFVLDDGWFGRRDDDTTSLGDWVIDTRKWPDGLGPLIDHVQNVGMTFGLWFEPEMVNPESDLFKTHPEWVMGTLEQPTGRAQWVLDISLPEVTDYLFDAISAILTDYPGIEYIKWDHNRVLPHTSQRQTHALYRLIDRINSAHPNVEIESCASGGGRIDFGILQRTKRFWTSDSNDAAERWKIQRGSSYFFPPEITGSHVGPRVCHTSGRQFPMSFRATVAASRAMGLEMDLRELTQDEADQIKSAIATFKDRRRLTHKGTLHRLDSGDPNVIAEMHVSADESAFILYAAQMQPSAQQLARPLRLSGLEPTAHYQLSLDNPQDVVEVMNRGAKNPLVDGQTVTLSGTFLTHRGLQLPNSFPTRSGALLANVSKGHTPLKKTRCAVKASCNGLPEKQGRL